MGKENELMECEHDTDVGIILQQAMVNTLKTMEE